MKQLLLFVVLAVLMTVSSVFAQDMGVQLIGGPEVETEPVNLDNLKIGSESEIDNWGILKITAFDFVDKIWYYNSSWYEAGSYGSGKEADYALLRMDVTNTNFAAKNYLDQYTVKCIFDDVYEYGGWAQQYDFNRDPNVIVAKEVWFPIDPMYIGHYSFGCTLPNTVVTSSKPLRMEITIDENELTYHIRK